MLLVVRLLQTTKKSSSAFATTLTGKRYRHFRSATSSVFGLQSQTTATTTKRWNSSSSSSTSSPSSVGSGSSTGEDLTWYTWGSNTDNILIQDTVAGKIFEPNHILPNHMLFPLLEPEDTIDETNEVDGTVSIRQVICGATDTALLLSNGSVYVVGTNKSGLLGVGHTGPVRQLTKVTYDLEGNILPPMSQVVLGSQSSAMVSQNGDELYTCGFGGSVVSGMGGLGHGNGESYSSPKLVDSLIEDGCSVQDVTLGESHMTVLTTEGEVLTTGASSYGRLGNGETSLDQLYLEPIELLQTATQIAGGKSFTLALSPEGVIYGWGRNHKGQLGTGFGMAVDMYSMEQVPCMLDADELVNRTVTKIAAGHSHAACITDKGELLKWGSSLHLEPVRVMELLHTQIVDVVCGNDYTMALDIQGHVYIWGTNTSGKLGVLGLGTGMTQLNQAHDIKTLTASINHQPRKVISMSAGWGHASCLVQTGVV